MKKKSFGDLVVGDSVWQEDQKEWKLVEEKITRIKPEIDCVPEYIKVSLSNGATYSVQPNYPVIYTERIWVNKEDAIQSINERADRMEQMYINKIDELVSKYDNLLKWKKEHSVT